jgi:anti-sigma regulatory factor (Ser/Thr protein kinase)
MHHVIPTPPMRPSPAAFRLRAEPESAATARRFTRRWLAELRLDATPVADDALLVITELVANAVQHTISTHILCRLDASGDELHVTVEDGGGTLAVPRPRCPADDAERGRGLLLVAALAASWEVIGLEPEGRAVRATLKIGGYTASRE